VPQLVQPEEPVAGETLVERVNDGGARFAAHCGTGEMAQQRCRFGVRHAQCRPVAIVARAVHVRQQRRCNSGDRYDLQPTTEADHNHERRNRVMMRKRTNLA